MSIDLTPGGWHINDRQVTGGEMRVTLVDQPVSQALSGVDRSKRWLRRPARHLPAIRTAIDDQNGQWGPGAGSSSRNGSATGAKITVTSLAG
jgi:hypothetical protein